MGVHSEDQEEAALAGGENELRSVQPCNFRAAGRLSNENARALTAIHATFARQLTNTLDAYVGTEVKVKLLTLEQTSLKEHVAGIAPFSYIVPISLSSISSAMIFECGVDLAFPIIDLLLGGAGATVSEARELSEIEDEIMQDLTALIAQQAESAFGLPSLSMAAKGHIEPAALQQYCPPNDRVTVAKFEVEVIGITGAFQLAFPSSFVSFLIKQTKVGQPQKKGQVRYFPATSIRERILDCDFVVAADLPSMKVSVRDLVGLQPGCVLKLRAPVRTPGMLTVGGREIFEAVPVRNGAQKAAQVGRRVAMTSWGKE